MKAKLTALAKLAYDKLGDPRTKNIVILVLALMSLFGIIAPETATSLRDAVMAMAL